MEPILFMVHRIPYPPNKGDKIRSFNILRWLSQKYEVHLGCFVDCKEDRQYVEELKTYCRSYKVIELNSVVCKLRSLSAFVSGAPLTVPYFSSKELGTWVSQVVEEFGIQKGLMFSSSMGQYLEHDAFSGMLRVLDLVDVDSDKWRQYAIKSRFPMSWVYRREYVKLSAYEKCLTEQFDSIALVSNKEAELFRSLVNVGLRDKIHAVSNGVDSDFFNTENKFDSISLPLKTVSFTGAMDYWANEEAVDWFCKNAWPLVVAKHPDACFYIVGTSPSPGVLALDNGTTVIVTGRVKDVRPYLNASAVVVAPLRIARGIQNKVLEALSMKKFVIGTTMAFEGIEYKDRKLDVVVTDDEEGFSKEIICQFDVVEESKEPLSSNENRGFVTDFYNWDAKLSSLIGLLQNKI